MLTVTSIAGATEALTDYVNPTIKRQINGDISLSFAIPRTQRNAHSFDMVEEEAQVDYDGISYRIKALEERVINGTPYKVVTAPHVFFDLIDEYIYGQLSNGTKSIAQIMSFIFADTPYTFTVIDAYDSEEFENFGNDNVIALFNNALERYESEFEIIGNDIKLRKKIGSVSDEQFRFGYNVKTFRKSIDTSNLSTYIKGYGRQRDDGTYEVEAEYTSPDASKYPRLKHAPPYQSDSITQYDTLLRKITSLIQDKPEMTIELEATQLPTAGLGDIIPTIYEPLDIDLDLRIMEIEEYPESNKAPKVVLSTALKTFAGSMMSYQKALLDKIYDEASGKLRENVYSEAVKRATEALNNSLTELEYPAGMGIIARDPNDANRFVALRSAGLGVTTDGGVTFKEAITADGVTTSLLTAGQIKTNNVQIIGNDDLFYWDGNQLIAIDANDPNKFVRTKSGELYISKGALVIEREDGYKIFNNGMLDMQHSINSSYPEFYDAAITKEGFWLATTSSTHATMGVFFMKHISRYAVFSFFSSVDDPAATASIRIKDMVSGEYVGYGGSNTLDPSVSVVQVDLGVPTGVRRQLAVELRSTVGGIKARARIFDRYLEG